MKFLINLFAGFEGTFFCASLGGSHLLDQSHIWQKACIHKSCFHKYWVHKVTDSLILRSKKIAKPFKTQFLGAYHFLTTLFYQQFIYLSQKKRFVLVFYTKKNLIVFLIVKKVLFCIHLFSNLNSIILEERWTSQASIHASTHVHT